MLTFLPITLLSECSNYTNLEGSDRGKYSGQNTPSQCDKNSTPGWYRFRGDAGNQMAASCVDIQHCDTHAPGWMNGTHPAVTEGVPSVKACFNWTLNCCRWSVNIRVHNCSGFYGYELKKPPKCRVSAGK